MNRTGVVPLCFSLVASVLLLFVLPIESVKSLLGAILNFRAFTDELKFGVNAVNILCFNVNTIDDTWGECKLEHLGLFLLQVERFIP